MYIATSEPLTYTHLAAVQPPFLAITRTFWSEWARAWWPSLELLLATVHVAQPPIWLSQEPSDLSGLDSDSPPWLSCKFPLEFPLRFICRTVSTTVYCALFTFCSFWWLNTEPHHFIHSVEFCIIRLIVYHWITVWLLFNYCSIIVHFSVLEMYSRYFDLETRKLYLLWSTCKEVTISSPSRV